MKIICKNDGFKVKNSLKDILLLILKRSGLDEDFDAYIMCKPLFRKWCVYFEKHTTDEYISTSVLFYSKMRLTVEIKENYGVEDFLREYAGKTIMFNVFGGDKNNKTICVDIPNDMLEYEIEKRIYGL